MKDKVALLIGDVALTIATLIVVSLLYPQEWSGAVQSVAALVMFVLTFICSLYVFELYDLRSQNGAKTVYRLALAYIVSTVFLSMCFLLLRRFGGHRDVYMTAGPVLVGITYIWRRVYAQAIHVFATREGVLVIGSQCDAETVSRVTNFGKSKFNLVGFLMKEEVLTPGENGWTANGEPARNAGDAEPTWAVASGSFAAATAVAPALAKPKGAEQAVAESAEVVSLGFATAKSLEGLVAAHGVRSLVVRSESIAPELASTLTRLRFQGVRVYPLPEFYMKLTGELPLEMLSDAWLSFAEGFDLLDARVLRRIKRLMDLLLASIVLLLSLPVLLLAAIAIKLDSRGPVLFRQERVGWMGKPFKLLKLRSMGVDAEGDGRPQWASVDDPRVTRVGRILRKFRIDEIPQLINVLRGEMSFVGPRPERPEFMAELTACIPFYHLRHYVAPGITGWAQVMYPYGACVQDARRKLQFDLCYIRNASPFLDLRIVLRTASVVLFGNGSH
ncbi:MAG TPA: sugar transferase [Candidatus Acidoferrum sp.]|nr:sugar transferase [Candidatus Acidoferrum sp.]